MSLKGTRCNCCAGGVGSCRWWLHPVSVHPMGDRCLVGAGGASGGWCAIGSVPVVLAWWRWGSVVCYWIGLRVSALIVSINTPDNMEERPTYHATRPDTYTIRLATRSERRTISGRLDISPVSVQV